MILMALAAGLCFANAFGASKDCSATAATFLNHPSPSTLNSMLDGADSCWSAINSLPLGRSHLVQLTGHGNRWIARYVVSNLSRLDGGDLEDAFVSLGQFSEIHMHDFLRIAKNGMISPSDMRSALTMLPDSVADDPKMQLGVMNRRLREINSVADSELKSEKTAAADYVREFIQEIKRSRKRGRHLGIKDGEKGEAAKKKGQSKLSFEANIHPEDSCRRLPVMAVRW